MRFSRRLPMDLRPSSFSQRLQAVSGAVDLSSVNATRTGLGPDAAALCTILADPDLASYHPDPAGHGPSRQAIAAVTGSEADRVFVTASTSEAYSLLFKILCDPGDSIALPAPSYPLFEHLVRLEGCTPKTYRSIYDGTRWRLDLDSLEQILSAGARVLVTVSPNNPTGTLLSAEEQRQVDGLCARHGVLWISDEVFAEYIYAGQQAVVLPAGQALRVTLDGLSKRCGMPQMKLAWMILHGDDRAVVSLRDRLSFAADAYLSVSAPVQLAAARLLEHGRDVRQRIRMRLLNNRASLTAALAKHPAVELLAAEGGWYAVLRVPRVLSEEQWVIWLAEQHGVIVQPGFFYDFEREAYLVFGLLHGRFEEGLERLMCAIAGVLAG